MISTTPLRKLEMRLLKEIAKIGDEGLQVEAKRGNYTRVNRALALESEGYLDCFYRGPSFQCRKFYTLSEDGRTKLGVKS